MAKKLGRASAGEKVLALAQQFSQSLLADENATFDKIDLTFARPVAGLRDRTRTALKRADGEPSSLKAGSPLGTTLRTAHRDAMGRTERLVQDLAGTAHTKAAAAILKELQVCEATLAGRYAGIAEQAVKDVAKRRAGLIDVQMIAYRGAVTEHTSSFMHEVGVQFREAVDEETLLKRLFSLEPAGLRGFGGRGIWWRSCTEIRANARAVAIGTANTTRTAAMQAFNARYDEVG